jgi:copper chaperone CopZ
MIIGLSYRVIGEHKIHCLGCEARIAADLRKLRGVYEVMACPEEQAMALSIDTELVSAEQVEQRLTALGYQLARAGAGGPMESGIDAPRP